MFRARPGHAPAVTQPVPGMSHEFMTYFGKMTAGLEPIWMPGMSHEFMTYFGAAVERYM